MIGESISPLVNFPRFMDFGENKGFKEFFITSVWYISKGGLFSHTL